MSLKLHDPPGFVKDLLDANKQTWHVLCSSFFLPLPDTVHYVEYRSDTISALMLTENVSSTLTPQFYDQTKVVEKNPTQPQKITWIGFPKKVCYAHHVQISLRDHGSYVPRSSSTIRMM